jgi:CRISPR-associated protein Csd1
MLLQELRRYAQTRGLVKESFPFYAPRPVRYVIDLDATGKPTARVPLDRADAKAKGRAARGADHLVPSLQRTVATVPLLLCDTSEYLFGRADQGANTNRAVVRRAAMLDLVRACAHGTGDPDVQACLAFLSGDPVAQMDWPEGFANGDTLTLTVNGRMVVDRPTVRAWWAAHCDPATKSGGAGAHTMTCHVCGQVGPVLDRMPEKVKGVPRGQTSGTALISANAPAFESYGLEASRTAPTCAPCAQAFTLGANHLLADLRATYRLHDVGAYSFWTREVVKFDPLALLEDPEAEDARAMLEVVERGGSIPEVDDARFFGMALAGSGGRAAVRDWLDTTVGGVRRAMATWFLDMQVVGQHGTPPRRYGTWPLAATTVRDPAKELTPHVMRSLIGAAVAGRPFPLDLLGKALRRLHAKDTFSAPRAALIAMCLRRHPSGAYRRDLEGPMLNENHPNAGYQCGRLLCALEDAQRQALPGVKAGIVDRFYGTASTAPRLVFGRLVKGAQAHLSKLERDRPGTHRRLQVRIEQISARIEGFPAVLSLADQGLFALGYYHQRAHDHAEAAAWAERRRAAEAGQVSPVDAPDDDDDRNDDLPVQAQFA